MDKLFEILPPKITSALIMLNEKERKALTEIRLRVNRPAYFYISGIEYGVSDSGISKVDGYVFSRFDADIMWRKLCDGAPYSTTKQQKEGYITVGGNRVGFCGEYAFKEGEIQHVERISSFCVRIKHEIIGCGNHLYRKLFNDEFIYNTLIVSPPGCGKTTLVRDFVRILSNDGVNVAVADERDEICACENGIATLSVGKRVDVINKVPKAVAIENMIRVIRPGVIVMDEIGNVNDLQAVKSAKTKGVGVIATAHGKDINDIYQYEDIFERFVFLSNRNGVGTVESILDGNFKNIGKLIC